MEAKAQSLALIMRLLKLAFIVSGFLYFYMVKTIPSHAQRPVSGTIELALTIVAFMCIVVGYLVPRFVFRAAESRYQSNPALTPQKRWLTKGIMSLAYFEACILIGFALHLLGAPMRWVELLFGVGIVSMLFWSPGTPPTAENGEFPQG